MFDGELYRATLEALDRVRPEAVLGTLRQVLVKHVGARKVRLLLADYQLNALRPIQHPDDPEWLNGGTTGEVFTTQVPVMHTRDHRETDAYLPVSVRGDRLGVLELTLPARPSPDELNQLHDLATLVGYVLAATSRHTDLLHRAARSRRFTLAAELQWQLLPARGCRTPEYELAGHLEPAYAAYADNFDWSEDESRLLISITDAASHARDTPLLTTLAVTAARNARRTGLGISQQAAMADQAVYAHHQGAHCVSTLLLSIDITTGRASAVRAGSPQVVLVRGDEARPIDLTDQFPIGMFEGTEYVEQSFDLKTGDRLVLMSDGVFASSASNEPPALDTRLLDLLKTMTHASPHGVVRGLIDDLMERHQRGELDDDAVLVCLDWKGPGEANVFPLMKPEIDVARTERRLRAVPTSGGSDQDERLG